jgi:septal ring-binding cell division protein DamX
MNKEANEEPKSFASSVFLVAAVASVMVAGMFLRSEAPHEAPPPVAAAPTAAALPLGSTITPELPPPIPPTAEPPEAPAAAEVETPEDVDPVLVRLVARAQDDCARLGKARGRWTAQLLVACKPETVDRLLATAGAVKDLYVLPAQVRDESCFRVCFGSYATSKDAASAVDLPKALRGKEKIGAVEVAKVLP